MNNSAVEWGSCSRHFHHFAFVLWLMCNWYKRGWSPLRVCTKGGWHCGYQWQGEYRAEKSKALVVLMSSVVLLLSVNKLYSWYNQLHYKSLASRRVLNSLSNITTPKFTYFQAAFAKSHASTNLWNKREANSKHLCLFKSLFLITHSKNSIPCFWLIILSMLVITSL